MSAIYRLATKGFTIIEVLVVVSVIGILAGIIIVSYSSIQRKAYDDSVQSDLDSAAGLLESYRVSTSSTHQFPKVQTDLTSIGIKAAKSAYDSTVAVNFVYCVNTTDYQSYALVALSKSGNVYLMTQDGLKTTTITRSDFTSTTNICTTKLSIGAVSAGMSAPNTWQSWVSS